MTALFVQKVATGLFGATLNHDQQYMAGVAWHLTYGAPRWLWRQFLNVRYMLSEGIPVLGFTWYSLTDQVDWDVALRDERNLVNPVGLYDLNRQPRPVAAAYRQIIREFSHLNGKA